MAYIGKTNWVNNEIVEASDMNRIEQGIENSVEKLDGKGLSTNDYTTTEKNKLSGIAANANNYSHPTTAGNKHIPTGGTVGQVMLNSASGTGVWGNETNTKVARFVVGTSTAGWTSTDCDYLCDGTADQTEINAAITALPATGGEVVILDGTYNITATIDFTKDNVSIRGNGNATILKRMFNSSVKAGVITLISRSGCKIANLQIEGNKTSYTNYSNFGIYLNTSSNNTITSNTFNNNSYGINLNTSSDNTITGNTCNNSNFGINLNTSSNNTITSNTCNNNSDFGIYLNTSSDNNTVTGNTCNNNNGNGISLESSNNNTITSNTFNNNSYGINLNTSSDNTITGNTCNNNGNGIYLNYANNNTVTGNTCNNSNFGINLNTSNNNTVTSNTCNNNDGNGIYLNSSSNNAVTGNACNNNGYGIYLNYANNNTVTGNTCIRGTGLSTDYTASQHTIQLTGTGNTYNLISNNNCMGKAPTIEGGIGNTVFNNKFDAT